MIHKWSDWFLMLTSLKLRCKSLLIFFGLFDIYKIYFACCVPWISIMCGKSISSSGVWHTGWHWLLQNECRGCFPIIMHTTAAPYHRMQVQPQILLFMTHPVKSYKQRETKPSSCVWKNCSTWVTYFRRLTFFFSSPLLLARRSDRDW